MSKLLLSALLLMTLHGYSQFSIQGKVVDTSENRSLHNAVVSILRPTDSILLKFTRTASDGSFSIANIPTPNVIILISFPGYADFLDHLKDSTANKRVLGTVPLIKKSELLEAVIVQRRLSAIRMRGDTLAFAADSFSVRQGSTVDELLKQLPGIQVDRNGVITAQGEKVNKVLVDGEEFFSDDPAVVIKNLQAEAVKEVQVFDKKSEQSEFTGIDDGQRSKTINLALKPEKKKGYFARAALNGGTNSSFDNDAMFNTFKGTRKIALFGIMSNTGRQGLNWNEMDRFGGGNDVEFNEEEGYFFVGSPEDEFSRDMNNEDGLPSAWSGGFHFSDKWLNDKRKVNTNYRFLKKNLNSESTTRIQYILPDTQYFNNQSSKAFNSRIGHQLKGVSELKLDSLSDLKITLRGSFVRNENASRFESRALNADSGLVNLNSRLLSGITDKQDMNAVVLWRKRFQRKGQTFSLNVQQQGTKNELNGNLQSSTEYYNTSSVEREEIDQKKNNTFSTLGIKATGVYTHPVSKTTFLSFTYGVNYLGSEALRNSFNKGNSGIYDKLDSTVSNDFRFRYLIQSAGTDVKINQKKVTMILGSGVNFSDFRQTNLRKDSSTNYSFTNFFPRVYFKYSPRQSQSFNVRYNGRTNPPNLEQLQPVQENTDPLFIKTGNPLLKQEFVHTLTLTFHTYQVMSERGMYFNASGNLYKNAISSSTSVDAGGKTVYQPINVSGNYSFFWYGGYHMKIKKPGIYFNLNTNVNFHRMTNKVNNLENVNTFSEYNVGMYIGKSKNEKYSFSLRPWIGYTYSRSSLRPDVVTKYFISQPGADAWVKLPGKFEIWTDINIFLRQQTEVFATNRNVVKWDASLSRKFLKNNNLELRFFVADILDQNIGFNRTANSNIINENSFVTLRRRCMIGLIYNVSKNP